MEQPAIKRQTGNLQRKIRAYMDAQIQSGAPKITIRAADFGVSDVHVWTIYKLAKEKRIPPYRIEWGKRTRDGHYTESVHMEP